MMRGEERRLFPQDFLFPHARSRVHRFPRLQFENLASRARPANPRLPMRLHGPCDGWMDGWTVGCTVPAFRRLADWLAGWLAGWLAARPITNGDWNCIPQRWLQRTTLQTFPFNLSALRALLKSLPRRTSGFTSSLGGLSVKSTYSLPKDRTSPPRWHGCREWGGGRSGKGESRQNSSPWITFSGLRLEMAGRHRSHVREHGAVALRLLGSSDFSSAR